MPKAVRLAFTECMDAAREEEFNRWYTHTHIPDLSKAPGFARARRFVSMQGGAPSRYLAIYEFDSPSLETSFAAQRRLIDATHAAGRYIDCLRPVGVFPYREIEPAEYQPLERVSYPVRP